MEHVVLWFGAVGAWLLVAGPLLQALLELGESEQEQRRIRTPMMATPPPPPVSHWWLLMPPVAWWKHSRRQRAWQQAAFEALPPEDQALVFRFFSTATAWFYVAGGAFLIALKETYDLVHEMHWHVAVFCVIVVAAAVLCVFNAWARATRGRRTGLGGAVEPSGAGSADEQQQ